MNEVQEEIIAGKNIKEYSDEAMRYLRKPLGKALYATHNKDEDEKKHWSDLIKCKICGRRAIRSNMSQHKRSKYCQAHSKVLEKVMKLVLEEELNN